MAIHPAAAGDLIRLALLGTFPKGEGIMQQIKGPSPLGKVSRRLP